MLSKTFLADTLLLEGCFASRNFENEHFQVLKNAFEESKITASYIFITLPLLVKNSDP